MKKALALFGLPLLLAACGGAPTPSAPTESFTATSIQGRIVNNHSGVESLGYTVGTIHKTAHVGVYMGDASAFQLPLPTDAEMVGNVLAQSFETAECAGVVTVSDPQVQTRELGRLDATLQEQPNGKAFSLAVDTSDNLSQAVWVYADRPTTVTGSETCTETDGTSTRYTYSLNLVKGWNTARIFYNDASSEARYVTQALGTTEWYWYDKDGNLGGCVSGC